jgi:hypothetical protein
MRKVSQLSRSWAIFCPPHPKPSVTLRDLFIAVGWVGERTRRRETDGGSMSSSCASVGATPAELSRGGDVADSAVDASSRSCDATPPLPPPQYTLRLRQGALSQQPKTGDHDS